ncbi:hypothetical protein A4A49_38125 [Nicotiana attenuata]|uniref:Ankyrin repeat-containing protein n=1 Tax=Nicotiana attenuata TaxID=49451 RepID=A0A1J6JRK2_NICAT|nr:hypothetical protein A4A49_38125 [Nicotiana attenuata]
MQVKIERKCTTASLRQSAAYTAANRDDEKSIEILRDFCREEMVSPIDNRGDTILHFIAIHGNVRVFRLILEERPVSSEDLRVKNKNGDTPLHEAARFGRKEIVKIMLNLKRDLVLERNNSGETPIYVAAASGEKEVFILLAENNFCDEFTMTRDDGRTVLHAAVTQECYYFALQLLGIYPELASKADGKGTTALNILATKHLSFRSGSIYTIGQFGTTPFVPMQGFETFMYFCIPAMYGESKPSYNLEDAETTKDVVFQRKRSSFVNSLLGNNSCITVSVLLIHASPSTFKPMSSSDYHSFIFCCSWVCVPVGNAWLGEIDYEKQKHILAVILARRLIREEDWSFYANFVPNPLIQATKHGINELVMEIIQNYPQAVETVDEDGKNILHIAAEQKNRFLFDYILQKASHKDRLLSDTDQRGNTIMHFAASVGSPFKFSAGKPIKTIRGYKTLVLMAWGVLWFKVPSICFF